MAPTEASKAWGLEVLDSLSLTGFPVDKVSLPFAVYTVPASGKQATSSWFKNVRPEMPWSGLIHIHSIFNGNNDASLRDVWRGAHYIGKPVNIPPIPPLAPSPTDLMNIAFCAGGMDGRYEWVRGEKVRITGIPQPSLGATVVRCELRQGETVLVQEERPIQAGAVVFALDTAPWAYGAYDLRLTVLKGTQTVATLSKKVGIRFIPPKPFNWEIWYAAGSNPRRADMEVADVATAGLEIHTGIDVQAINMAIRHGLGFSARADVDLSRGKNRDFPRDAEFFRLDNEGKPVIPTGYGGGRPTLGVTQPEILHNARDSIRETVKKVSQIPAFRPYVLCNDDMQDTVYGWDYSPHVLKAFKRDTGLDAPRKMVLPEKPGPIPDDNPWLKWFQWTLIHVSGGLNRAETDGALAARPDVRIGPIPGGMQIPLVCMWQPSQYPPYNFGKNGFNLICCYYYNTYWQPLMTITFWMDIGRMANRDLPEWTMPDAFMTAGYTRNSLFHYLAGGVKGLAYFWYGSRSQHAWSEFHRLGKMVHRIGPVQTRLAPAKRDIGLLNSFTSNCFEPSYTLMQAYAYHNLLQGHFDVEITCEEEILDGRAEKYKALLLYNVKYLRQSVYDKLAAHAAKGGLVILDNTIPFDIPGAKRLAIDVGMGKQKKPSAPSEGAHSSTPGITDYGHGDRIEAVKKALVPFVRPQFDSSDIKLAAWRMEADGVPYTWFVNVHDSKEYMFCRERMGAGHPGAGTPEKVRELQEWEEAEMAKGPFVTTVEFDRLPGVPYELVRGRRLAVSRTKGGRYAVTLDMERFGGALVAWLPNEIRSLKVESPKMAMANQPVSIRATVCAENKPVGGPIPVEFVLWDPKGKRSVVSGVRATQNGSADFQWTPAVNDPSGAWTLQVNELASGKTARTIITLAKGPDPVLRKML